MMHNLYLFAGTLELPQGPVWIGKDFRLDRTPRAP